MAAALRWWFLFCLSALVVSLAGVTGDLEKLWHADVSRLSAAALGTYFVTSAFIGYLTVAAKNNRLDVARAHAPFCWYVAELLLGMGMAGTLIGFLLMLGTAFHQFDANNVKLAQQVIAAAATGLATAGLSTLVGLVSSFLIKAQLVNLEYLTDPQ